MKLAELARKLDCQLEGDGDLEITGVAGIDRAQPGEITFLTNPRYKPWLKQTRASAIIVAREAEPPGLPCLRSDNPYLAFARAVELFYQLPRPAPGIHPTAVIAKSAQIGPNASIGPYCFVDEEVTIGKNAVLHSFVAIYRGAKMGDDFFAHSHAVVREFCRIGHRVTLQNGAMVGPDGFGFARRADASYHKIVQAGTTVIEDDVEIQANACIDRATVGETRIRRGTKIDNLVQVGHASTVGEDTLLCAQAGLAGSTHIGNRVILAGQVGCAGHLTVGDGAIATAQTGIPNDVPAGQIVSGYPAMENKLWRKCAAVYARLPELQKTVRELKEKWMGQN